MHQLTINHASAPVAITTYPSFDAAQRALLAHAIGADYYLWTVATTGPHTRYRLVRPTDPNDPLGSRRPRITGTATINELRDSGCRRPGEPAATAAPPTPGAGAP